MTAHPKGWKRKYTFPRQADVFAEKQRRIEHLNLEYDLLVLPEIQEFNANVDHSLCTWKHPKETISI